jgi:hypothetical protein
VEKLNIMLMRISVKMLCETPLQPLGDHAQADFPTSCKGFLTEIRIIWAIT